MNRTIIVTFYNRKGDVIKTNRGVHPRSATRNAFDHLQMDHYDASVATVHDDSMGELHAVLTRNLQGNVNTVFKRDPKTPKCIVMEH